ncbi:Bifunctional enzyme CysN/CysC [Baekduia alba]|uniref:adenylyl-sulfate kinase n=1 Tax=Baekduia alba TaxID=2997333 RepID=UPI00234007F4|nr:adenylyl-sulfate kinase [Baekduia alba]WCB95225.1 Bifunctional enzyme CysN/CysC [Baekduia alba]
MTGRAAPVSQLRALEAEAVHTVREVVAELEHIRHGLNDDLSFRPGDRAENIRRVGHVARLLADAGVVAVVSLVSPLAADRAVPRTLHRVAELPFFEVFVDTHADECARRDPKGLYEKARAGQIQGFTGVDAPYEAPERPEVRIPTAHLDVDAAVERILEALRA